MPIRCSQTTGTCNKNPNVCLSLEILFIRSLLMIHCSNGSDHRSIAQRLSGKRFCIAFFAIYALRNSPPRLTEIDTKRPVIRHANSAVVVALVDSLHVAMLQFTSLNLIG